jgi:hypothetical protein
MKVAQTKPATSVAKKHTPFFNKGAAQDFINPAVRNDAFFKPRNSPPVQTKLNIGKAGDHYEKEADAMADRVVQRLNEPGNIQKKPIAPVSSITPLIQNKCASCEQEEKLQKKEKEEDKELSKNKLQKKPIFESNAVPPPPPPENTDDKNSLKTSLQKKSIFESNDIHAEKNNAQRQAAAINNYSGTSLQKKSNSDSNISQQGRSVPIQSKAAGSEKEERLQKKEEEDENRLANDKLQKKPIFESSATPPDDENNVQPKCAECGNEEKLQKKNDTGHDSTASSKIETGLHSSKGSGSPLPQNTRQQMESSFGSDFSDVRIHNDSSAEQMSKDLNAQAFTHGNDIYFNSGKYDTNSTAGKHLLAHELTHTVQQNPNGRKDAQQPAISNKLQLAKGPASATSGGAKSGSGLLADGDVEGDDVVLSKFPLKQYSIGHKTINAPTELVTGGRILKVGERKTNQDSAWKKMVKEDVKKSILKRCADEGLTNKIIIKRKNKEFLPLGKPSELAERDELINPQWDTHGNDVTNEIEHKVDALIAGNGDGKADNPKNLMLLDKKTNRSIGSGHVRSIIKNSVDQVLDDESKKSKLPQKSFAPLRKNGHVKIKDGVNTDKVSPSSVWEQEDFKEEKLGNNSNPLSKKYLEVISGTVPKGSFILKTKNNPLGYIVKFKEKNEFIELKPDKESKPTKIEATIKQLWRDKGKAGGVFESLMKPKKVDLVQSNDDPEVWTMNLPSFNDSFNVKYLSPLILDEGGADFNPYSGIEAKGKVKSDIPILRDLDISFKASGSNFTITTEIDTDYFSDKVPKPFSIDYTTFEISASTEDGLSVGGDVGFSIEKIGKGSIRAGIGKDGFSFEGNFNFDSKLFKRAAVRVSYIKKEWGIGGDLELKDNALKGIKSGSLSVSYAKDTFVANGTAVPAIKGFKEITLGLSAGPEGFEIDGGIEVEKLPGIKSGKGNVKVIKKGEDYSFEGSGKILPDVPGIESEVDFTINNGLFNVNVNVNYDHNRLSGSLHLGITNEGVGSDGKPDNKISDSISFYGGGTLGLMITENLKATAGVNIKRDGNIELSGRIELPKSFQLFPSPLPKKEKDLLPIPAIHIPIFAIPLGVANIGLEATIAPHLKAEAEIGPGLLTNVFAEIDYDTANPDAMTITGGADFEMRAYAMIKVGVDLDLGLSIGIASISGGLGLNAGVILEAKQPLLHTELKWSPKSGFDFQGLAQVVLSPKLFFSVDAHVKAHVVLAGDYTLIDKQLVNKEFDPGLDFGMKLPFHYQQGKPFNLSFSDIEFVYPKFDSQTLMKLKDAVVVPLKQEFLN